MATVYDFKLTDKKGQEVSLEAYKGKVLLIVNSATECGFTPQYDELEALYRATKLKVLRFSTCLATNLEVKLLAAMLKSANSAL